MALVLVMFMISGMAALAASYLMVGASNAGASRSAVEELRALYVAEAGLNEAVAALAAGEVPDGADGALELPSGSCWIELIELPDGSTVLAATAISGHTSHTIQIVLGGGDGATFRGAAFGAQAMQVADAVVSDSYNSSRGNYAGQVNKSYGGVDFARPLGNLGSNGDVSVMNDAMIFGKTISGPGQTVLRGMSSYVHKTSDPAEKALALDPVELPDGVSIGPFSLAGGARQTLPAGSYRLDSLSLSGASALRIMGPAQIRTGDLLLLDSARLIVDGTNGPVRIFVEGDVGVAPAASIVNLRQKPSDLVFQIATDDVADPARVVQFDAEDDLYAVIYAPAAAVELNGAGALYGALAARSVTLGGTFRVHYDEELMRLDRLFWDSMNRAKGKLNQKVNHAADPDAEMKKLMEEMLLEWADQRGDAGMAQAITDEIANRGESSGKGEGK